MKLPLEIAKKLFNDKTISDEFKKEFITKFGEKVFKAFDYRNIKTFNDACVACGTTEAEFNAKFGNLGLDFDTICYEMMKILFKAVNNGWTPDWTNPNEYKYYPWFSVVSSGSGLSFYRYSSSDTDTHVGSRLCTDKSEKAEFLGKQFKEIFEGYMLYKPSSLTGCEIEDETYNEY